MMVISKSVLDMFYWFQQRFLFLIEFILFDILHNTATTQGLHQLKWFQVKDYYFWMDNTILQRMLSRFLPTSWVDIPGRKSTAQLK